MSNRTRTTEQLISDEDVEIAAKTNYDAHRAVSDMHLPEWEEMPMKSSHLQAARKSLENAAPIIDARIRQDEQEKMVARIKALSAPPRLAEAYAEYNQAIDDAIRAIISETDNG